MRRNARDSFVSEKYFRRPSQQQSRWYHKYLPRKRSNYVLGVVKGYEGLTHVVSSLPHDITHKTLSPLIPTIDLEISDPNLEPSSHSISSSLVVSLSIAPHHFKILDLFPKCRPRLVFIKILVVGFQKLKLRSFASGWEFAFLNLKCSFRMVGRRITLLDKESRERNFAEHCWRSGESTPALQTMWPGFHSQTRRHMRIEFVGSLLCSERFLLGYSGFLPSSKINV